MEGGLGFRKFQDINKALLAKLGWLASQDSRLWVKALEKKYLRGQSFFSCIGKKGDSRVWKGVLSSRDVVRKGSCFRFGNGWSIDTWRDPWVPGLVEKTPSFRRDERLFCGDKVAELFDKETCDWRHDVLQNLFTEEEILEIQKLKCPSFECEDKLCWIATKDGKFSVKSCFELMANESREEEEVWKLIWKSKLHERLKLFLWRFASNVLPVNMVVINRIGKGDKMCALCGTKEEDVIHLFRDCHVSRALGFASK